MENWKTKMTELQALEHGKRECRLLPVSGNSVSCQEDRFYSADPKNHEQSQNKRADCKARPPIARHIRPDHKRMSRVLGYALTLGTADGWADLATVAVARLAERERFGLAWAALRALPRALAEEVAREALGGAGVPLPPFLGGMADARFWASRATPAERKACALAAYEAMSASDQAAFHRHISELEIAA